MLIRNVANEIREVLNKKLKVVKTFVNDFWLT